ncbi:hypothetical protein, partial [Pseudomonas sp. GW704-F5]|uniref:hypothetical protein n=1 Tax=Pseudomonas sp. GW704-F5 TaxID=2070576 RepID=UPI000CC8947B
VARALFPRSRISPSSFVLVEAICCKFRVKFGSNIAFKFRDQTVNLLVSHFRFSILDAFAANFIR